MTKLITVEITGNEYNAIMMALAAIGARAFGASTDNGVDATNVVTDAAILALRRIGGAGIGDLVQRLGDAAERSVGAANLTTNARETPMAEALPLPTRMLQ